MTGAGNKPGPPEPSELFERVTSLRSLWAGALRAAAGKRHRPHVARTLLELEGTVVRLQNTLRDGTWVPGRPSTHIVQDHKRRVVSAAPFEDRIVQQALCGPVARPLEGGIGPLLDRHLIEHTYACRLGRGTHAALRQAIAWARSHRYFVRLDVQKYFPTIDHEILLRQLERDLPCAQTLALCARIVSAGAEHAQAARFHFGGDDLFTPFSRPAGLPIGSLTSQHFANRFLSPVDHRAKDRLRIRPYLRYMDDMLLFDDDRQRLHDRALDLQDVCERNRLRLHPWQIMPVRQGVGFLGFRILPDHIRLRRTSVRRAIVRFTRLRTLAEADPSLWPQVTASIRSTFAHWAFGDTWRVRAVALHEAGLLHADAARELRREKG